MSVLLSGNGINHALDLSGIGHRKAGCFHHFLDPFAVRGMAIAALHQLKENGVSRNCRT